MQENFTKAVATWFQDLGRRTGAFAVLEVEQILGDKAVSGKWDMAVRVLPAGGSQAIRLLIEAQQRMSPLLAMGILERMPTVAAAEVPVLCTRLISDRVAELCRARHVSYLDEAGNCRIAAPGLFVQLAGNKPVRAAKQSEVDAFATKSSRIVRVLLSWPKRGWQVRELANEARVSLGLAAKVKRALSDNAFTEQRDRRTYLRDPKGLLEAWASRYRPAGARVALYTMRKTDEAERMVANLCAGKGLEYALTDLSGAWRLAPTVRYHSSTIRVELKDDAAIDDLIEELGAKRVDSGANLVFQLESESFSFYQSREVDGLRVASPLQLYLDLHAQPGRSEDAAKEILEREVLPSW